MESQQHPLIQPQTTRAGPELTAPADAGGDLACTAVLGSGKASRSASPAAALPSPHLCPHVYRCQAGGRSPEQRGLYSRCPVSFCFIVGLLFPVVMGQGSLLTGISQPSQPCVTGVVIPVVTVSAG